MYCGVHFAVKDIAGILHVCVERGRFICEKRPVAHLSQTGRIVLENVLAKVSSGLRDSGGIK